MPSPAYITPKASRQKSAKPNQKNKVIEESGPEVKLTKKQMKHELTKLKLEKEHLLLTLRLKNETKKRIQKQSEIDRLKEALADKKQKLVDRLSRKQRDNISPMSTPVRSRSISNVSKSKSQKEPPKEIDNKAVFSTCLRHAKSCKRAKQDKCLVMQLLASLKDCGCCSK